MKTLLLTGCIACVIGLAGCAKKSHDPNPSVTQRSSVPSAMVPGAADRADQQQERAKKQALLGYATMEDGYINDPHAQWANSAKASSTFGNEPGATPSEVNLPNNMTGRVDGKTWTNNEQSIGFDWIELGFARPVHATEVRVVFADGKGVEAVNRLELQDTTGQWTTVWSGLSDVKADDRGNRTWYVKTFPAMANAVQAVKVTIANSVQNGYKVVDAAQLVGE